MADDNTVHTGSAAKSPADAPAAPQDKGTFLPLIFGGAVATALGFFAGQLEPVEEALGLAGDDQLEQTVAAQSDTIAAQQDQIAALTARLDGLPAPADPVDLTEIEGRIADLSQSLDGMTSRLSELEKRPMTEGVSEEAIAAYEAELARFKESAEAQRAEIERLVASALDTEAETERKARAAQARTALSGIIAAIGSGAPFPEHLAELEATLDGDVPAVLTETAPDGVTTLAQLQTSFPGVARAALSEARAANAAESGGGSIGSFLQRQLGARSVTPKEGDDPDAVLSRAEAAVRSGQLDSALAEIQTLPQPAQAAMSDWIAAAETRHAATSATQELMSTLGSN